MPSQLQCIDEQENLKRRNACPFHFAEKRHLADKQHRFRDAAIDLPVGLERI
jgi:hypothetical protein